MSKALRIKEIREYERNKRRAKEKNNLLEAANWCNCLGAVYHEIEDFERALVEHEEEISLSEDANDNLGVAVGHRKVGENLCFLNQIEEALVHLKKYLEIAQSLNNILEQQRAFTTLGRTYLIQAQVDYPSCDEQAKQCLNASVSASFQSLDLCDQLYSTVTNKEMLEMKARLYLNIGIAYDSNNRPKDALQFVQKALIIAKEQQLPEDIYRSHCTLSELHFKNEDKAKALQCAKAALSIAKRLNNMTMEYDVMLQMGEILISSADFISAIKILREVFVKPAYKQKTLKLIKNAIRGALLSEKYACKQNMNPIQCGSVCEKLADLYSSLGCPGKALPLYKEQLSWIGGHLDGRDLCAVYNSLAVTSHETKQYEEALMYHELAIKTSGDPNENFDTHCAVQKVLDETTSDFECLKTNLVQTVQCVEKSQSPNDIMRLYDSFKDDIINCELLEEYRAIKIKLELKVQELSDSAESPVETSSELTQEELEFLQQENDVDDFEEELCGQKSRKNRTTKQKINRVNAQGETPLHIAAIRGNFEKVKSLLQQGAFVHARDTCGWQPIHEACNHGYADIVELLISHGANVNDPGGDRCLGTTPLHDACENGRLDVVKLLIAHGACPDTKNKEGNTPIESVRKLLLEDEEVFKESAHSTTYYLARKQVEQYVMSLKKLLPKRDRNGYLENDQPVKRRRLDDIYQSKDVDFLTNQSEDIDFLTSQSHELSNNTRPNDCSNNLSNTNSRSKHQSALKEFSDNQSDFSNFSSDLSDMCDLEDLDLNSDFNNDGNLGPTSPSLVTTKTSKPRFSKNETSRKAQKVKRKTYRQSKIKVVPISDFIVEDRPCKEARKSRNIRVNANLDKPKQKRIDESLTVTDSPTSPEVLIRENTVFRVKVDVDGKCFLIPIVDTDSTVGWLVEQAQLRYQTQCDLAVKLSLKTKDGALLNSDDVIGNVLLNDECILGEITCFDFAPLGERYESVCRQRGGFVNRELVESFAGNTSTLNLTEMFLSPEDLTNLSKCLPCNVHISEINLSGTYFGDAGFATFFIVLPTLPNLKSLTMSCVGISCEGLNLLGKVSHRKINKEYRAVVKKPPLSSLNSLVLDYNDFSDHKTFMSAMSAILTNCVELVTLSLRHCELGNRCLEVESAFADTLNGSRLQHLNISRNRFTGFDDVMRVVTSMTSLVSLHLSLTELNVNSETRAQNFNRFENLSELSLQNMTSCQLSAAVNLAPNVQRLCIQNTDCSALKILKQLSLLKHLRSLEISSCSCFSTDSLHELLRLLREHKSFVKHLSVNACGVFTPLCDRVLVSANHCALVHLDLSYNELLSCDKIRLRDWWVNRQERNALYDIGGERCVLSRK